MQGIDEKEPVTGKLNRQWLTEEIADVFANMELVMRRFQSDMDWERVERKMADLMHWHDMA